MKKRLVLLAIACLLLLAGCAGTVTDSVTPEHIQKTTQPDPSWKKEKVKTDGMLSIKAMYSSPFAMNSDIWYDPYAYTDNNISRGDIVVFDIGKDMQPTDIARVVGLPGESIEIKKGQIYIDGKKLNTFYGKDAYGKQKGKSKLLGTHPPVELREQEYYVIGDLWWRSFYDSRNEGPYKKEKILGKVVGW